MSETQDKILNETSRTKDHRGRLFTALLLAITICVFFTTGYVAYLIYKQAQGQAKDATQLAQEVREKCASTDPQTRLALGDICPKADKVVEDAPKSVEVEKDPTPEPEPGPQGPVGPEPEPGPQGPVGPGPTDTQIQNALRVYCQANTCRGKDGRNATVQQVAAAVAAHCNSRNECVGDPGVEGAQGLQGIPGPPPSDTQVLAAVKTYCTNNDCRGPKGDTGVVATKMVGCEAREDHVIDSINPVYDAETRTITITCTQVEVTPPLIDPDPQPDPNA